LGKGGEKPQDGHAKRVLCGGGGGCVKQRVRISMLRGKPPWSTRTGKTEKKSQKQTVKKTQQMRE